MFPNYKRPETNRSRHLISNVHNSDGNLFRENAQMQQETNEARNLDFNNAFLSVQTKLNAQVQSI